MKKNKNRKVAGRTNTTTKQGVLMLKIIEERLGTSQDYSKFKFIRGQRPVMKTHVADVKASISDKGHKESIRVYRAQDGFLYIIEGQHRFLALKELGMPIRYTETIYNRMPTESEIIDEISACAATVAKWKISDQLHSKAELGIPSYVWLREFMELNSYPLVSMVGTCLFKSGTPRERMRRFNAGDLVLDDAQKKLVRDFVNFLNRTTEVARTRVRFKFNSNGIKAIWALYTKVPNFDQNRWFQQIEKQNLLSYAKIDEAKAHYEEIYNKCLSAKNHIKIP